MRNVNVCLLHIEKQNANYPPNTAVSVGTHKYRTHVMCRTTI